MATVITCPNCGSGERLSTVEQVLGNYGLLAEEHRPEDVPDDAEPAKGLVLDAAGCARWDGGGTEINWDTAETVQNEEGHPKLQCGACDHTWFETRIQGFRDA